MALLLGVAGVLNSMLMREEESKGEDEVEGYEGYEGRPVREQMVGPQVVSQVWKQVPGTFLISTSAKTHQRTLD